MKNPIQKFLAHRTARLVGVTMLLGAATLAATQTAQASNAVPTSLVSEVMGNQSSAMTMVQRYDFGRNLQTIAMSVARSLPAYGMMVKALGEPAANGLVRQKLSLYAPMYQEQWNRNLAASYSAVYTEEELQSFAALGPQSDHMSDFNAKRGDVGSVMRDKSQGLLQTYVTEAMNSAVHTSMSSEHASKD